MKRAEVWQLPEGRWTYGTTYHLPDLSRRIGDRTYAVEDGPDKPLPTHEAALTAALAEVGLTPGNPTPLEAP